MLLQALARYYDILLNDPDVEIAPLGYSETGVSYALNIAADGELLDVLPLFEQVQRGKKTVEAPRTMFVPEQFKRSSGLKANFLCDNPAYVLGTSEKDAEKPGYSAQRFAEFKRFHRELLQNVDSPAARAVLAFLERHDPAAAAEHPVIRPHLETLLKGGNIVFMLNGAFVHEDPAIRQAWADWKAAQDAIVMQDLITGEEAPIVRLHPNIKGVYGAQPTGATLVGFNLSAFRSYNRESKDEKGLNAPTSIRAAFAYGTALNYLLSRRNPNGQIRVGDTTVVFWAESESRQTEAAFACLLDPDSLRRESGERRSARAEGALKTIAERVRDGWPLDLDALLADLSDEDPRFYVLGLAPNSSRLSVRFFISDPFRKMLSNVMAHYRDLEIVKEYPDQPTYLSPWRLLNETVSPKASDKTPSPLLGGAVMRAILLNTPYPAALYNAIITRVRADADNKINYARAAIIKACLLRKYRHQSAHPIKEVLTMSLNEASTNPAYVLGRLFAWLERAQQAAIGKNVNATIKDRYFTSACATPASVFPVLLRLAHHHFAKAEYGRYIENQVQALLDKLEGQPFPRRLTLDEQGVFILGYYHQRAAWRSEKEEPTAEETAVA